MMSATATSSGFVSTRALGHLPAQQRDTLQAWGCGAVSPLPYTSIHQAFEAHAAAAPEAIAARWLDQSISYRQLNRQANRLAAYLIEQGLCRATVWHCLSNARSPCWWGCSRC